MDNPIVTGIIGYLLGCVYTFFWTLDHADTLVREIVERVKIPNLAKADTRNLVQAKDKDKPRTWQLTTLPGSSEEADMEERESIQLWFNFPDGQRYLTLPKGMTLENFDYFVDKCCKLTELRQNNPVSSRVLLREFTKHKHGFTRRILAVWKAYLIRHQMVDELPNNTITMNKEGRRVMLIFHSTSPTRPFNRRK